MKENGYEMKRYGYPVKRYCQTMDLKDDPELIAKYEDRYQKFRQIYPACKPLFEIIK